MIVLGCIAVPAICFPQDSLAVRGWTWVSLNYGAADAKTFSREILGSTLSYAIHHQVFSARILIALDNSIPPIVGSPANNGNGTSSGSLPGFVETSVLTGPIVKSKFLWFSLSGGVGYVWGFTTALRTATFPFEFQLGLTPVRGIGISISFHGSINHAAEYEGVLVSLHAGRI